MILSRVMVVVIMIFALVFALVLPNELVNLLILGYDGVCQFFPGVVFGLFWKRVTKSGVLSGIVSGVVVVFLLIAPQTDPFLSLNAGFVALVINILVTVIVSLVTKPESGGFK